MVKSVNASQPRQQKPRAPVVQTRTTTSTTVRPATTTTRKTVTKYTKK